MLTAYITCAWAGVDSAGEQEKLKAIKMLENPAESYTSGARFVSHRNYNEPDAAGGCSGSHGIGRIGRNDQPVGRRPYPHSTIYQRSEIFPAFNWLMILPPLT